VFTQTPPQSAVPEAHEHEPATQLCPDAHAIPQAPQFDPFVCVSTHDPPQLVVPAAHVPRAHTPALQIMPVVQP
jgi:hypothetical protein